MSGVRERVRETLTWTGAFEEATFDPEAGIIRNCMPIRAGMSRNGRPSTDSTRVRPVVTPLSASTYGGSARTGMVIMPWKLIFAWARRPP